MGKLDTVSSSKSHSDFPQPREDEESLTLRNDWSIDEEKRAKRKYVITLLFSFPSSWEIHKPAFAALLP
jgi:hypothetical protein